MWRLTRVFAFALFGLATLVVLVCGIAEPCCAQGSAREVSRAAAVLLASSAATFAVGIR
jgi:hypothetical protein